MGLAAYRDPPEEAGRHLAGMRGAGTLAGLRIVLCATLVFGVPANVVWA